MEHISAWLQNGVVRRFAGSGTDPVPTVAAAPGIESVLAHNQTIRKGQPFRYPQYCNAP